MFSATGESSWEAAVVAAEGRDSKSMHWVIYSINVISARFYVFVSLSTEKRELWNDRDDDATSPSRTANRQLLEWLENNEVYVSEMSDWGQAPHLLGLSSET